MLLLMCDSLFQVPTWKRNCLRIFIVSCAGGLAVLLRNNFAYISAFVGELILPLVHTLCVCVCLSLSVYFSLFLCFHLSVFLSVSLSVFLSCSQYDIYLLLIHL